MGMMRKIVENWKSQRIHERCGEASERLRYAQKSKDRLCLLRQPFMAKNSKVINFYLLPQQQRKLEENLLENVL